MFVDKRPLDPRDICRRKQQQEVKPKVRTKDDHGNDDPVFLDKRPLYRRDRLKGNQKQERKLDIKTDNDNPVPKAPYINVGVPLDKNSQRSVSQRIHRGPKHIQNFRRPKTER